MVANSRGVLGVEGSAGPWRAVGIVGTLFLDQDSPGGTPAMPTTNQWAVSVLIREVLADPDLGSSWVLWRVGYAVAGAAAVVVWLRW